MSNTVKVEIYDQTYHLRGEIDEAYAQELAQFVDGKMRSITEATHTVDSLRVAVLAAINMADELFSLRERQKQLQGEIRERAERALALVDRTLKETA